MSVTAFLDINRGERLFCTAQWPRAWQSRNKSAMKSPSLSLNFSTLSMAFSFGISGPNGTSELVNQLWPGQCAMNFGKLHQCPVQNKNPQHVAEGLLPGRPLQINLKILEKIGEWRTRQWMIQRSHIVCRKAKVTTVIMSSPVVYYCLYCLWIQMHRCLRCCEKIFLKNGSKLVTEPNVIGWIRHATNAPPPHPNKRIWKYWE